MSHYVVVKDGRITDCTSDSAAAVEKFLSRNAEGMYRVESLDEITELLDTDWDKELNTDWEAQIGNMWSYLSEGVKKIADKAREFDTETKAEELRTKVLEMTDCIRETGQRNLEEFRAYLKSLRDSDGQ